MTLAYKCALNLSTALGGMLVYNERDDKKRGNVSEEHVKHRLSITNAVHAAIIYEWFVRKCGLEDQLNTFAQEVMEAHSSIVSEEWEKHEKEISEGLEKSE